MTTSSARNRPRLRRVAAQLAYYTALARLYDQVERFARHDCYVVFHKAQQALERYGPVPVREAKILEVGCGRRFPATLLFHTIGSDVIGIDSAPVRLPEPRGDFKRRIRSSGLSGAVKEAVRRVAWDRRYYRHLERAFGQHLRFEGIDVRQMDACALTFEDRSFDFIFSNAVFEHIADIDGATSELTRVLVPGGVAHVSIHLFPSLSGGHFPGWAFPDERTPRAVPAWDHLRGQRYPAPVYLNGLRTSDYLKSFERHLSILRVERDFEGEHLFTQEIADALPSFSRDDLLTRRLTVVLRKERH